MVVWLGGVFVGGGYRPGIEAVGKMETEVWGEAGMGVGLVCLVLGGRVGVCECPEERWFWS